MSQDSYGGSSIVQSGRMIKLLVRDKYFRDWCLFPPDAFGSRSCPDRYVRVRVKGIGAEASDIAIWCGDPRRTELRKTNNISTMIEAKIDELIAAIAANTSALTGKAPKSSAKEDKDEDKKPESEDAPTITLATLREKATKLVDAEKGEEVKAILEHYEAKKLAELDKTKFAKVDTKFDKLLAKLPKPEEKKKVTADDI